MGARIMNGRLWMAVLLVSGFGSVSCVKVTSFIPQGGQAGSEIEILGSGFSTEPTGNKVTFGELEAEVTFASEETLRARVPEGAVRAKIRVSRGWLRRDESETDYIPLPDYIRYRKFESPTLGIRQGYWIMYPPSFAAEGKKFPIVYALHGYNLRNPVSAEIGDLLEKLALSDPGAMAEHSWVFAIRTAGSYLPFIAQSLMRSRSVAELRTMLETELAGVAGEPDRGDLPDVVESIIYYLPEDPDSWLPDLAEMIIVMPDGDNSYYADRLGPPDGRNEQGLGAEPSFPTSPSESPAGRLDSHVTGWYDRYMMRDVIEEVEVRQVGLDKLVEEDARRFILGISMGGAGSLRLALRNPDRFVAVASLGASGQLTTDGVYLKNLLFPEQLDVFGSAPMPFGASQEEVEANVHLDSDYVSAHDALGLIESLDEMSLHFFLEIGENDRSDGIISNTIADVQEVIDALREKRMPVEGGIVSAASEDEPANGNADHVPEFWRTRFGAVLKFFSDASDQREDG